MLSNLYYLIDERGGNPVKEFIDGLSPKEQTKVFAYMVELLDRGHQLRRPTADYLGQGLYELRPKDTRVFYFFFHRDTAVLVHALRKKTDKIPVPDFQLCLKRKHLAEQQRRIEKIEFGGDLK